jgi:proteasome-associated ATPase
MRAPPSRVRRARRARPERASVNSMVADKRKGDKTLQRLNDALGKTIGVDAADEDELAAAVETTLRQKDAEISRLERARNAQGEELAELQTVVKAYEEKFNQMKEPPLLSGYVLRLHGPDLGPREVGIHSSNQVLKVNAGNIDKNELKQGQYVWLHPKTYAIIGASQQFEQGLVARVADILPSHKIVVTMGEGFEKKVIDTDPALGDEIKIGYEVSLLPPTYEILEVRPSSEIRDLFLGEKPNVRYEQVGGLDQVIGRIRDVVELPYKEPELFAKIKLKPPKGTLLYGPPGCGKTLIAKAVANSLAK